MITQKQIKDWIPDSLSIFQKYMPMDEVSRPLPSIQIGSPETIAKVRAALVEQTGSLQEKASGTAIMEMLHGDKGDAILIQQQLLLDPKTNKTAHRDFQHNLWHELGHFYAINTEKTNLYRYFSEDWTWTNSPERSRQEGYWMWAEFIAEAISCRVEGQVRRENKISEEIKEWLPLRWYNASDKLQHLLNLALRYYESAIDEAALGIYFATLLADDTTRKYIQAMANGKLQERDLGSDFPGKMYRFISPDEFDAEHIEDFDPIFHDDLIGLKMLLEKQLKKSRFWDADEDFIEELGNKILSLTWKKQQLIDKELVGYPRLENGEADAVNPFANLR